MDLSVVAAVGSFVVSERVLKPKATVLVVVGFVLIYDLTMKTNDVSSLRVYRGPSLLALSMMLFAYSLRTWRRNGVACDELIFLPGTQHGQRIGIEGPLIESIRSNDERDTENERTLWSNNVNDTYTSIPLTDSFAEQQQAESVSSQRTALMQTNEGAALGVDSLSPSSSSSSLSKSCAKIRSLEMIPLGSNETDENDSAPILSGERNSENGCNYQNNNNRDGILMDTKKLEEGDFNDENSDDEKSLLGNSAPLHTSDTEFGDSDQIDAHGVDSPGGTTTEVSETLSSGPTNLNRGMRFRLRRWAEQHPHLAQLWTFFFNRKGGSNNADATYAPSGPAVFGASLDLILPVLFNFHVFILTFNHVQREDYTGSEFYAKFLPIAFLTVLYARLVIPPAKRLRFWGTMKFTLTAPLHKVIVRDEFIGDCLTSWVRIGQDLVFATIYYFIVIWGTLSRRYNLTESGEILAESWCVHNIILPLVAIVPLWLKYMQTLRQAYDAGKRWPYLGNSFKYLSAALVIIYGTFHFDQRRSPIWIACFIFAMFYQIFWDVVMDWQLFEMPQEISVSIEISEASRESSSSVISYLQPDSRLLLCVQMYVVQPIQNCCRRLRAQISGLKHIQLRQRRLYKTDSFYWKIFFYNAFTRFTWMCCFIPAYHISRSKTVVLTSTSDVVSYWAVFLPAAELFRRTLWGFLYMEKETIRMMDADSNYHRAGSSENSSDIDTENDEMTINSKVQKNRIDIMPTWLGNQLKVAHDAATTRAKRRRLLCHYLFMFELSVWAAGFVILGIWVAM